MNEQNNISEERKLAVLNALSLTLASKRSEAMAARASSGVESDWEGDEEFYQGYDDANRHEFINVKAKPTASGASSDLPRRKGSTVFPNITQPYVDAAAARVGDMLMPTDDRNFQIEATPIPELGEILGMDMPEQGIPQPQMPQPMAAMPQGMAPQGQGMPPQGAQMPQGMAPQGMPQGMPPQPVSPIAQAVIQYEKIKKEAAKRAEKAQTRIDDWLTECQYHAEVRKVIDDAARIGSGVLKGPVPMNRASRKWGKDEGGGRILELVDEIKPGSRAVNPWNFFPDGACGDNIHNGSHCFERDHISSKKLEELKKLPGYLASQIDMCIEEGPKLASVSNNVTSDSVRKGMYEIWYFYGDISAEDMEAAGIEIEDSKESYPALLTIVNDLVIHAALNPMEDGAFPYDVIPWKRRPDSPWGIGVSRQIRTPQRIVTAATRNLMDNAGLAGGPQFIIRRGVEPENGIMEINPFKIWLETADSDGQAGAPFLSVVIPMLQVELNAIIMMGMKMAEDVTGLPQLMQGQQGAAPDTVGGMTILNNNANSVLRRFARLFDSCITEPHIRRYYQWLMLYGEEEDEKGDFQIVARGSSALIERDIQSQEMVNILQMTLNPAFGKSPKKAMDEYLKSRRFDPSAFDYSDEEKAQMANQPPQPPPQIAAAQIRAETDMKKTEMQMTVKAKELQATTAVDMQRIKSDTDRDVTYVQAETQRTQSEHQARMAELQLKLQIAQLDYASKNQISVDELKSKLAIEAAKLKTTKELAGMNATAKMMPKPPVEPPGRAPRGQSFPR